MNRGRHDGAMEFVPGAVRGGSPASPFDPEEMRRMAMEGAARRKRGLIASGVDPEIDVDARIAEVRAHEERRSALVRRADWQWRRFRSWMREIAG